MGAGNQNGNIRVPQSFPGYSRRPQTTADYSRPRHKRLRDHRSIILHHLYKHSSLHNGLSISTPETLGTSKPRFHEYGTLPDSSGEENWKILPGMSLSTAFEQSSSNTAAINPLSLSTNSIFILSSIEFPSGTFAGNISTPSTRVHTPLWLTRQCGWTASRTGLKASD